MNKDILKTSFNGLNKTAVLMNIDAIEALFLAVQSGAMEKETAIAEAEHIVNEPIKKQIGGFAEEGVRTSEGSATPSATTCRGTNEDRI